MAIEGQLEDISLADICQLLAMGRKSGCLTVTDRSSFGYVYFEDGRVVHANVLNRPDRLGELLVQNGVIRREDLSAGMEQQARVPGDRLGQILVSMGALSAGELERYITIQVEEAVYHLFTWERGSFNFEPDVRPDETTGISINAESLLLEGARRVDEWSQIEKKIPSMDLIFSLERDPRVEGDLELTPDQVKLLPLLDGNRTAEDLVRELGMVEFEVAKALFGLVQAGFAVQTGRRESPDDEVDRDQGIVQHLNLASAYDRAGMLEEAEREYRAVLSLDGTQATARARMAVIALRTGRPEAALEHYEAAPPEARRTYDALRNRALALEFLDRHEEALALLDRAAELRTGEPALLLHRGILLLKARRARQAVEVLLRYRMELPRGVQPSPLFYAFSVLAFAVSGDRAGALQLGREGLGRFPDDGAILVNLGVVLELQGEASAAEALYLRAVADMPPPPQAHKNLGDMAYRRGDRAGARAHYERAVRLDPSLGDDVYLKLGNLAYKDGDRDLALELWRRALELNPRNEVARTNLELVAAASPP